jgi:hypothetical protein
MSETSKKDGAPVAPPAAIPPPTNPASASSEAAASAGAPKNEAAGPPAAKKPPTAADLVATLEAHRGSRVFVFAPSEENGITEEVWRETAEALDGIGSLPSLDVIIQSGGGRPGHAFKAARLFQERGGFTAIVPSYAKSAATMMCLGAKQILMNEGSELGPLDTQIPHPHEPEEMISALEGFKGLEAVSAFCQRFLDEAMLLVLGRTGRGIKDSLELATNFAAPVVRPLFEQIDPMDLGRYKRALEIGVEYAQRLLESAGGYNPQAVSKIVARLVYNYPVHDFVIDMAEARKCGVRVERPDLITSTCAPAIVAMLPQGSHVGFLEGGTPIAKITTPGPTEGTSDAVQSPQAVQARA